MGWLIALGVVVLLAILPLGASVRYNSEGALVRIIAGPFRFTVFPKAPREKKEDPKAEEKKAKQEAEKKAAKAAKKQAAAEAKEKTASEKATRPLIPKEKGGSWTDFLPLVKVAVDFLGDFRRKLRVNVLQMKLIMAADDPCDLAVNYGRAWAALGNLMPQLERLFVIIKRDIQVECDFTAEEISVIAHVDITITLGRLLTLAVVYGIRVLFEFLSMKRKGGGDQ